MRSNEIRLEPNHNKSTSNQTKPNRTQIEPIQVQIKSIQNKSNHDLIFPTPVNDQCFPKRRFNSALVDQDKAPKYDHKQVVASNPIVANKNTKQK